MSTPLPVFIGQLSASIAAFDPLVLRITDKAGDAVKAGSIRNAPKITGSLRTSIKKQPVTKGVGTITITVSAGGPSTPHDVDYAQYVHDGTSRQAPNPFMLKALNKVIPQWEKELANVAELLASGKPGRASGAIKR